MIKKSFTFLPLVVIAMMASCSKNNDSPVGGHTDAAGGAYLSLTISTPLTRANDPDKPGSEEESAVSTVKLLTFDKEYNFIGLSENKAAKTPNVFEFEVAPDAYRFFVVTNPTAEINKALGSASGNWNTVEAVLQTVLGLESRTDINSYITDNAFPMVNAGSYDNNIETVLVRPIDAELVNGKLSTDKANPSEVSVTVDRMVAKFTAEVNPQLKVSDKRVEQKDPDAKPFASIDGVLLNVVNKKSYIYSHINSVNSVGDDYRADPNMSVIGEEAQPNGVETALTSNFFWLHNYESPVFKPATAAGSTEYVFENTATGESFNYNNLTQLMVKATYIPTGQKNPNNLPAGFSTELTHDTLDLGSWFAINIKGFGTMQMTFKGIKGYYQGIKGGTTSFGKDTISSDRMDTQLRHMLSKAPSLPASIDLDTVTWGNPEVTCALLNTIPNGGYVAATVANEEDYIVQFYQFGLNYYDIFIQHDEKEAIGHLGRWGMVRNNHYTLTINSITGPGYPYIPDPTDPEIKDPQNPDPKDPEPADKGMAYIEATIVVNPWTMWTQDVDLN